MGTIIVVTLVFCLAVAIGSAPAKKSSKGTAAPPPLTTGFVYVLSNPTMPGLLKIGKTDRDVETRVRELSRATGVPTPFHVEHTWKVEDSRALESYLHRRLDGCRVPGREFFRCDLETVLQAAGVQPAPKRRDWDLVVSMWGLAVILGAIVLGAIFG